jgi:hypothetical protein
MENINFKIEERDKKLRNKILITPFYIYSERIIDNVVEKESIKMSLVNRYKENEPKLIINDIVFKIISDNKFNRLSKLLLYIINNVTINSNKIILDFNNNDIKEISTSDIELNYLIDKLEEYNIIRRSTINNVYIVNHNIIFRGDIEDFIKAYTIIHKTDNIELTVDSKVILDNTIDYAKQ